MNAREGQHLAPGQARSHDTSAQRLPPLYYYSTVPTRAAQERKPARNPLRIGVRSSRRSVSELWANAAGLPTTRRRTDRPQCPINNRTALWIPSPLPVPSYPVSQLSTASSAAEAVLSELALGSPFSAWPRRRTTYAGRKQGMHAPPLSSVVVQFRFLIGLQTCVNFLLRINLRRDFVPCLCYFCSVCSCQLLICWFGLAERSVCEGDSVDRFVPRLHCAGRHNRSPKDESIYLFGSLVNEQFVD